MKSPTDGRRANARKTWILVTLFVLAAVVGYFGYTSWKQASTVQAQSTTKSYQTKAVRRGTITLGASGSVTLVASQEEDLAFSVSGTVAQLNVAVGDQVKKDQVLAQLDNLDELQADIKNAGQELLSAQQDLAAFKAKAPANLANAQLKVINAQKAVEDAQSSVVQKDWTRCDQATKDAYYNRYVQAVDKLNALGDGGGHADYYLNTILPQKKIVDQARAAYDSCSGYTDYQVASSNTNLSIAQANLKLAQDDLDTLTRNNGLDPTGLATAENNVDTAQNALDTANENLTGATLKAPFAGTVLSVAGKAGDTIDVSNKKPSVTFITIADLAHPVVQFSIDETDLSMAAPGEAASVTFDAFPDRAIKGTVARLNPTLSTSNGATAVTGLIQLDLSQEKDVPSFPKNLSGSVQLIKASAENVLLIPIEALHQQSDGTYRVYVPGADGQPVEKTVTVGLSDVASAQIKSGLSAGDVVITSPIQ